MSIIKKIVVLLILFVSMPIAIAEIQVTKNINQNYNISDKLSYSLSIIQDKTYQGFLTSTINCDKYSITYFTTPLSFIKDTKQDINIPELILTDEMLGYCNININIQNLNKNTLEQITLGNFFVGNNLEIDTFLNKQSFKPGDQIEISGTVKNNRGELLNNIPVSITIDNKETKLINVNDQKFSYSFKLDNNVKSFEHSLYFEAKENNNIGKKTIQFYVTPIPTRLKNGYTKVEFLPGETVEIESLIYDQADDLIDNNAQIKVYNPKDKLIIEGTRKVILQLSSNAIPGEYEVKTSYESLKIESTFKVKELEKLDSILDGKNIILKSTGNIPYKDEIRIILNDKNSFSKSIDIKPNEQEIINLAREIPESGTYLVKINTKYETKVLGQVTLTKELSFFEGLSNPITGAVVSVRDNYGYFPFYAVILAVIIAVILIAYQRNKKTNLKTRETDRREGEKYMQNLRSRRENPEAYRKRFNIDEKEISDFRKQMLKNITNEKTETKKQSSYSSRDEDEGYRSVKPKTGKGLFSMFD